MVAYHLVSVFSSGIDYWLAKSLLPAIHALREVSDCSPLALPFLVLYAKSIGSALFAKERKGMADIWVSGAKCLGTQAQLLSRRAEKNS